MKRRMRETLSWLRAEGFIATPVLPQTSATRTNKRSLPSMKEFNLRQRTEIGRAFDRGNYANAYEGTDLDAFKIDDMPTHMRAAFVLGFFDSYELDEISDREIYDECYFSKAGQYVVNVARYTDSRDEDYKSEEF